MENYRYQKDILLQVLYDADVVVVGGGFGGICASLASSALGAKTVLIERANILGGQAAEIDTWGMDGFVNSQGKLIISGFPWKILQGIIKESGSDPFWGRINMDILENKGIYSALAEMGVKEYLPYIDTGTYMNPLNDQYINPHAYRDVASSMLKESGVQVLLGMPVIDVVREGDEIQGVVVQGEFQKYVVRAKRIVDTSQNAMVCAHAGKVFTHPRAYLGTLPKVANVDIHRMIDYVKKTPENWFVRPMVGKSADANELEQLVNKGYPIALDGFMTALNQAIKDDCEFAQLKNKKNFGDQIVFFYEQDGMGAYWIFSDNFRFVDASDPIALSHAMMVGRHQQYLTHKFFTTYVPGFEHAYLTDTYANISKAYDQSFEESGFTEYDIKQEEIQTGDTDRADIIVKILGHPKQCGNTSGWGIPLASLIPKGLDHVLVTGKPACRKIHYIASCAMVGQAAGASAAISALKDIPLRQCKAEDIRNALRSQDVSI